MAEELIQPIPFNLGNTKSRSFRVDQYCAYHSGYVGHDTEECANLKHKIQGLIEQKAISLHIEPPNVTNNPLPNHEGVIIKLTEMGRERLANTFHGVDKFQGNK